MSRSYLKCCLCGELFPIGPHYWGNNPEPLMPEYDKERKVFNVCCDKCNAEKVIPARLKSW